MNTIKTKFQSIIGFFRRKPKTSVVVVLLIGFVAYSLSTGGNTKNEQVAVVKGTVKEQVAVTGKTVSVHDVSLGFEKAGTIATTPASVGSRVTVGQVLVTLDNSELAADLAKAKANLAQEVVKLETTRRGSSLTYGDARSNLISKLKDAYAKADDAIRNNVDTFFKNPRQSSNYVEFSFRDGGTEYRFPLDADLQIKINSDRYALERVLTTWQTSLQDIDTAKDLNPYVLTAENNLNQAKLFLNTLSLAANSIVASEYQYEATINGYKTTVSDARTSVSTAITNLLAAKEKVTSAPKPIADSTGVTSVFDDVLSQQARVEQFQAEVDAVRAQIEKTVIRSPINGLVTKQDAEVGEIVTSGTKLVSVISDAQMEIEANVSEVNIGKLNINNVVSVTFDAFPGKVYTGKVFYIEPAETLVDDVVNYKIKVSIDGDVKDLKSGLTANLTIETRSKDNVLKVPRYSVVSKDGKTYVEKVVSGKKELTQVEVMTGLMGSDGFVEVSGDIGEGDVVQVPVLK